MDPPLPFQAAVPANAFPAGVCACLIKLYPPPLPPPPPRDRPPTRARGHYFARRARIQIAYLARNKHTKNQGSNQARTHTSTTTQLSFRFILLCTPGLLPLRVTELLLIGRVFKPTAPRTNTHIHTHQPAHTHSHGIRTHSHTDTHYHSCRSGSFSCAPLDSS